MNPKKIKMPGVYINEINTFPNAIAPTPTAVPAFVGYTPQATSQGKSYLNKAVKITCLEDFQRIFCHPDPPAPSNPARQYSPDYYLVKQNSIPENDEFIEIENEYYAILPDPNSIYYLYNSIKLFYENGGGNAYIVSVGAYGPPSGSPTNANERIVNSNVRLKDLQHGIRLLKNEIEPTLYICPEATLLSVRENGTLMQDMLLQNEEMQTAMSIFDIIGGNKPDPILYTQDIENFRNNTGTKGLQFGAAYYPFIGTNIMQLSDIDYDNLFGGNHKVLERIINPLKNPNPLVVNILNQKSLTKYQKNAALINASKTYATILKKVLSVANTLPPSGGIAGVITSTDNAEGVWKAPANVSIIGAHSLPIHITEKQQGDLNIDAVTGKSINAIRYFNGLGILIWGARTLDGNSQDWRYISVRRTMILLEQSSKLAAQAYVFEPNDKNTWTAVTAMISNFLNSIWKQGGLQGATPADAFQVNCGLGSTMTSTDILNGLMRVSIKVAITHPAEFIVLTIEQEMQKST